MARHTHNVAPATAVRFREFREQHLKWEIPIMATMTGLAESTIRTAEYRGPSQSMIALLCDRCNMDKMWFMTGHGEPFTEDGCPDFKSMAPAVPVRKPREPKEKKPMAPIANPDEKKENISPEKIILDFTDDEDLLEKIVDRAKKNRRNIDQEIMYILDQVQS